MRLQDALIGRSRSSTFGAGAESRSPLPHWAIGADFQGKRHCYTRRVVKHHRPPKWVDGSMRCSFCGKPEDEVEKLIAGPGVYICNRCVGLCDEIIEKERTPSR